MMSMNIEATRIGVIVEHRRGIFVGWPSYCQPCISLVFTSSDGSKGGVEWAMMHFRSPICCLYCLKRLSEKYVESCTVSASAISGPTRFHIQIAAAAVASCRPFVICYQNSSVTARATVHTHTHTHTHTSSQQIS